MSTFDKATGRYTLNCLNTDGDGRGTEYLGFSEGDKVMTSSNYMESKKQLIIIGRLGSME